MTGSISISTTVARKPNDVRNATTRVAPLDVANTAQRPGGRASAADLALVGRLVAGDEAAFTGLVEQYNGRLLRLARVFVNDHAVAEEVVQDTWLGRAERAARVRGTIRPQNLDLRHRQQPREVQGGSRTTLDSVLKSVGR